MKPFEAITLAILVLGVAAPVIAPYLLRERKLILYHITTVPVALVKSYARDAVKVTFDGQEVSEVYDNLVTFSNRGNRAITPADFVAPLSISVPEDHSILSVYLTAPGDESPRGLDSEKTHLSFPPVLINPGEEVVAGVLATCPGTMMTVHHRIVGVSLKKAGDLSRDRSIRGVLLNRKVAWSLFALFDVATAFTIGRVARSDLVNAVLTMSAVLGLVYTSTLVMRAERRRRYQLQSDVSK